MWIWIGVGYNMGLALLTTFASGLALAYCNPPKMRPVTSADESAAKMAAASAEIKKKRTERRIKSGAAQLACCLGRINCECMHGYVAVGQDTDYNCEAMNGGILRSPV